MMKRYSEQMLLALLRSALHQREVEIAYFSKASEEDWVKCFRLAVHQGVAALTLGGIERLPSEYSPPLNVKLSWALAEQEKLEIYEAQCKAVNELTDLFEQHGIGTVVLKGVGLSRLYPIPARREGGDVDIYTYSSDKSKMSDDEANRLADRIILDLGETMDDTPSEKHSKFTFKGVTFENHRKFLHIDESDAVYAAEKWLQNNFESQTVELLDGQCEIQVPSERFDTVFVSMHAAQHYGQGLSLKHLCDWTVMLMNNDLLLPPDLDNEYFLSVVSALTQLCNRYLGISVPIKAGPDLSNELMKEILYPPYFGKAEEGTLVKRKLFQLENRLHIFTLQHNLLGVSFIGKLRGLLIRKFNEWFR